MADPERRALNESVFREMNERLEELSEEFGEGRLDLVCECADPACSESLSIRVSVYEGARRNPRRFLVVPGHEWRDTERVIEVQPDYVLVEKVGEGGEVAEDTDPRPDG